MKIRDSIKVRRIFSELLLISVFLSVFAFCLLSRAEFGEPAVIEGKDGWLFYDAYGSIEEYQGKDLFTEAELADIRERLLTAKEWVNSQGAEFIIFIAPNKEHVYPEYMPDEYGPVSTYTCIEQLMDYLSDDFTVITPLQRFLQAKTALPRYELYYKTDTHWNDLGAYVGAQELMNTLGEPLPGLDSLEIKTDICPGLDLARMNGTEDIVTDNIYELDGYGPYKTYRDGRDDYLHYHTEGAPERSLVILGDSFSMVMAPYLGQCFEDIYLHQVNFDRSRIEEEHPAVVVYEIVERGLFYLNTFGITDE